jgi:16S rRNA processing protein RimM
MTESAVAGDTQRVVVLGRVSGAFGVAGWVKVQSYTDPPANILKYKSWQLRTRSGWQPVEVLEGRMTNKGVQARLDGVAGRDAAAELRGIEIGVWRSELPELATGEYYWEDLLELEAFTLKGESLGRVDHFSETPAHALMIVKGEREHWIPLAKGRIKSVDTTERRLVVDWELDW